MSVTMWLRHRTDYRYPGPAALSAQFVRLRPSSRTTAPIRSYSLRVEPESATIAWQDDRFGNHLAVVTLQDPTEHFGVEVDLHVDLVPDNPFDFVLDPEAETMPVMYGPDPGRTLVPYRQQGEAWSGALGAWFDTVAAKATGTPTAPGPATVGLLLEVAREVADLIGYEVRFEPGVQSAAATFDRRAGSCRDSAWLLVEAYRKLGLAARFVSGYLIQLARSDSSETDGPATQGPGRAITGPVGEDSTDLHAWAEVYLPGAGWIGIDPTSGLVVGEGHIPLAAAPTPAEAAPISGTSDVAATNFGYANTVVRMLEWPDPDPTARRPDL